MICGTEVPGPGIRTSLSQGSHALWSGNRIDKHRDKGSWCNQKLSIAVWNIKSSESLGRADYRRPVNSSDLILGMMAVI